MWAPGEQVSRLIYFGLYALQHRGQESAGIATTEGQNILVFKDMGLVSQVFNDQALDTLPGHLGVGHVRYSTTGSSDWKNAQPTLGPTATGTVALAHNGNLVNTTQLRQYLKTHEADQPAHPRRGRVSEKDSSSDTQIMTAVIDQVSRRRAAENKDASLLATMEEVLPMLEGAFSLAFIDERTLYAARDRRGIRPLVLGRLSRGWVVASETAALDIVGATYVRDIEPGEIIAINDDGIESRRFAPAQSATCIFEYVYLARPDTQIGGTQIIASRRAMGAALAAEHPVEADMVMATPESGTPAAVGYAEASGIPYGQGVVKNAYVGRTFIQPTQSMRQMGIRIKLNPVRSVIAGKRLVVIDDSIVRGNTQRALVQMLRDAGAREVHVRISSPPVMWPCYYGIDFATRAELIASGMNIEEIRQSIGADSLGFLSMDAMVAATGQPATNLCAACFSGQYPSPLPDQEAGTLRPIKC